MKDKNHLIRRTTLDLSLNNGRLNEKISATYKAFFQSTLLPILNQELDKFQTSSIVQIDKWELNLGDIPLEAGGDISDSFFQELESRFRSEIQKKIKKLKTEEIKAKNPLEIIQDYLEKGVTERTHFLGEDGFTDVFAKLSANEKKEFISFVIRNKKNTHFLKRLISQFTPSDLDNLFESLSPLYKKGKDGFVLAYKQNKRASKSISQNSLIEGFRKFWVSVWGADNLDSISSTDWDSIFSKGLVKEMEKLSGPTRNQEISKTILLQLKESAREQNIKEDLVQSELLKFDYSALTKSEEKEELLSYILTNGSLPIQLGKLSIDDLKAVFLGASSATIRSLRPKLPRSNSHMFWKVIREFDLSEIKQFMKILFSDKRKNIQELSGIVTKMHKLGLIVASSNSLEEKIYHSIFKVYGQKKELNFELHQELFKELEKIDVISNRSKNQIDQIQFDKLKKSDQKVVKQLLSLIEDGPKGKSEEEGLKDSKIDSKVHERDIYFSRAFILDFLRYYFQEGNIPWWGNDIEFIRANVRQLKAKSVSDALMEITKIFYKSDGKQAKREFESWIGRPKSLENILFLVEPELKDFILDKAFPSYRQVTFRKLVAIAIEVAKLNTDELVHHDHLTEELISLMSSKVINQGDNDVKTSFDLVLRTVAKLFNKSFVELVELVIASDLELLRSHNLNKVDLKTLLIEIEREDQVKRTLEEDVEKQQGEIDRLLKDVTLNYQSVREVMLEFLKTGILSSNFSYVRFQSIVERVLNSIDEESKDLKEILVGPNGEFFLNFLRRRNSITAAASLTAATSVKGKAEETKIAEIKAEETKSQEANAAEIRLDETNAAEIRPQVANAVEINLDETKAAEIKAKEANAAETKAAEIKNITDDNFARIEESSPASISFAEFSELLLDGKYLKLDKSTTKSLLDNSINIWAINKDEISKWIAVLKKKGVLIDKTKQVVESEKSSLQLIATSIESLMVLLEKGQQIQPSIIESILTKVQRLPRRMKGLARELVSFLRGKDGFSLEEFVLINQKLEKAKDWSYFDLLALLKEESKLSEEQFKEVAEELSSWIKVEISSLERHLQNSKELKKKQLKKVVSVVKENYSEEKSSESLSKEIDSEVKSSESLSKEIDSEVKSSESLSKEIDSQILASGTSSLIKKEDAEADSSDFVESKDLTQEIDDTALPELIQKDIKDLNTGDVIGDNTEDSAKHDAEEEIEAKVEEREIVFKSSASTVFAVLRYFVLNKKLPWWSVYEDLEDLRKWLKNIKRSHQAKYNSALHIFLEETNIRMIITGFIDAQNKSVISEGEESEESLEQFSLRLKSIRVQNSKSEIQSRDWFFDKMKELFGQADGESIDLKKALLLYFFKDSKRDHTILYKEIQKEFSKLDDSISLEFMDLIKEIREMNNHEDSKRMVFENVKDQFQQIFSWNPSWGDLPILLDSWLISSEFKTEDEEEILTELLEKVTTHIAVIEGQTQANIILKLIRTNGTTEIIQKLQGLSDKIEYNDWLKADEDEKLGHELYSFLLKNEDQLSLAYLNKNDVFKLRSIVEVVESTVPSLYLLTIYLIQIKESRSIGLSQTIEYCETILSKSESGFESLLKHLRLLANSEWVNEAEIQTDYNKLFANLIETSEKSESLSSIEQLIEETKRVLEKDQDFYDFIENSTNQELEAIYDLPIEEEINEKWIQVKEGDRVFVANAGLAMIWPFLTTLFKNLGYLEDKLFKNFESQERAVHLLQYIVDGEEGSPDFVLILNKVLCGIPPNVPIRRFVNLTKEEKEEAVLFLTTVIGKWEQMKNTSLEVFRDTFLKRDGALMYRNERWHLKVEYKPIDILLIKLPWGISMIKYPWFKYLILVEWNNKS